MFRTIPMLGIDLGTSNSCAAVWKDGKPKIVPDSDGRRVTPSCVEFLNDGGEVVGYMAHEQRRMYPGSKNIIYDAKRLIGKRYSEVFTGADENQNTEVDQQAERSTTRELARQWPFTLARADDGDYIVVEVPLGGGGDAEIKLETTTTTSSVENNTQQPSPAAPNVQVLKRLRPLEISARVLAQLRKDAEDSLSVERDSIRRAVITHPAYFGTTEKAETLEAARLAGFTEITQEMLMSEPMAATLYFNATARCRLAGGSEETTTGTSRNENATPANNTDSYTVLVFDLGAGTFDITAAEVSEGGRLFQQMAIGGSDALGGRDFDRVLFEVCKKKLEKVWGPLFNDSPALEQKLMWECEGLKIQLSQASKADMIPYLLEIVPELVDELPADKAQCLTVNRREFEEACAPLLERIFAETEQALDSFVKKMWSKRQRKVEKYGGIDELVLVGGATRMPMVQSRLQALFPGKRLDKSVDADQAVALGAAVRAGSLFTPSKVNAHKRGQTESNVQCVEVIPLSLGVQVVGDGFTEILKRNSSYGTIRRRSFTTNLNNQNEMGISIYEGVRKLCMHNRMLAELVVDGLPKGKAGSVIVELVFELQKNGRLRVVASLCGDGNSKVLKQLDFDYKGIQAASSVQEREISAARLRL